MARRQRSRVGRSPKSSKPRRRSAWELRVRIGEGLSAKLVHPKYPEGLAVEDRRIPRATRRAALARVVADVDREIEQLRERRRDLALFAYPFNPLAAIGQVGAILARVQAAYDDLHEVNPFIFDRRVPRPKRRRWADVALAVERAAGAVGHLVHDMSSRREKGEPLYATPNLA